MNSLSMFDHFVGLALKGITVWLHFFRDSGLISGMIVTNLFPLQWLLLILEKVTFSVIATVAKKKMLHQKCESYTYEKCESYTTEKSS